MVGRFVAIVCVAAAVGGPGGYSSFYTVGSYTFVPSDAVPAKYTGSNACNAFA
jgi:hypothetical protein